MVVEFGALIKGEIEKPKLSLFRDIKWRNETYELNLTNNENPTTLEC